MGLNQENLALLTHYLREIQIFESESPIASTYLQLNQQELIAVLLEAQNKVIELFPVRILNDISLTS